MEVVEESAAMTWCIKAASSCVHKTSFAKLLLCQAALYCQEGEGVFSSLWLFYGAEKLRSVTATVSGVLSAALAGVACALVPCADSSSGRFSPEPVI